MEKFEIKNMLYKVNLKSRALSVMLYLVDRANKDLVCFPSIKTISSDLNISVSTTKRALNNLVETGLIEKIERFLDTTGKQTSNLYVINLDSIKNYAIFDNIEQVTEQNESEILEVFENTEDIVIEENKQQTENIKQNINLKSVIKNDKEIKSTVEKEDNILDKNINKKITIFELALKTISLTSLINNKNIKINVMNKFKKLENMRYVLKDYFSYINGLHPSLF